MSQDERSELLDALLDGSISEADLLRIEAELSVDAEVRQEYYRRVQLDYLLRRETAGKPSRVKEQEKRSTPTRWAGRTSMLAGVLIGLAASVLIALVVIPKTDNRVVVRDPMVEPSATGFAVLKGQSDAVWKGASPRVGRLFPSGDRRLEAGRIHLELFSGVQLVIEGDARFSIDSPMQVTMHTGRARARVPEPAQGFTIRTTSGDIVDLGTEFALDVSSKGSDVRVLDGEVELRTPRVDAQRLQGGMTMRLDASGEIGEAGDVDLDLIGPSDFQDLVTAKREDRIADWKRKTERTSVDPRLLVYYQFSADQNGSRDVQNLATSQSHGSDGAIVAADYSTNRWGQPGNALDFSRLGSRVRLNVAGEHRGLTLTCWVKINSLDRWYNSLFLTDGHEVGEPHWQIMDDGRIFFSVKLPTPDGKAGPNTQHVYHSPSIWDASLSGRWVMLSVTYDVDAKLVTHYVDGVSISKEPIPDDHLVESIRVGAASICNWSEPMYRTEAEWVVRNLNGSMDEFAMYSGALSSEEIFNLYRVGNPNAL